MGKIVPAKWATTKTNTQRHKHAGMRVKNMELFGLNPINKCILRCFSFCNPLYLFAWAVFSDRKKNKIIDSTTHAHACNRILKWKQTTMSRMCRQFLWLSTKLWNILWALFFRKLLCIACVPFFCGVFVGCVFFCSAHFTFSRLASNRNYAMLCQKNRFISRILLWLSFTVCNLYIFVCLRVIVIVNVDVRMSKCMTNVV